MTNAGIWTLTNHDKYFLAIAKETSGLSSCSRRHVGAVIVRDRRVLAVGYNGTPTGFPNCDQGGCPRCAGTAAPGHNYGACLCVHAEMNAIFNAASEGVCIKDSVIYVTLLPCLECFKAIVQTGIKGIYFQHALEIPDDQYEAYRQLASFYCGPLALGSLRQAMDDSCRTYCLPKKA
jgi:dCMP deaminase